MWHFLVFKMYIIPLLILGVRPFLQPIFIQLDSSDSSIKLGTSIETLEKWSKIGEQLHISPSNYFQ